MSSPTVVARDDFDAIKECEKLVRAMKSRWNTNTSAIIDCVTTCSNEQRQQIATHFKQQNHRIINEDLEKALVGWTEEVILALMSTPSVFLSQELHKALAERDVDDRILVEILCTKTSAEINEIKLAYQSEFNTELKEDIANKTTGAFCTMLSLILDGSRKEGDEYDLKFAQLNAEMMRGESGADFGMKEEPFSAILATETYAQLRRLFDEYRKVSEQTVHQGIRYSMGGKIARAMLAIVEFVESPAEFFARRLYLAMKGLGTDDRTLMRIIVSRSEIDLGDIKNEYEWVYGEKLYDAVDKDTSGDYKTVLLALIGEN